MRAPFLRQGGGLLTYGGAVQLTNCNIYSGWSGRMWGRGRLGVVVVGCGVEDIRLQWTGVRRDWDGGLLGGGWLQVRSDMGSGSSWWGCSVEDMELVCMQKANRRLM